VVFTILPLSLFFDEFISGVVGCCGEDVVWLLIWEAVDGGVELGCGEAGKFPRGNCMCLQERR
jgi:hypothetical protein